MKVGPIPIAVIALYIVLLYGVSWTTRKLSARGGMIGYLLAGRGLPAGVVAVLLAGLAVGGASTVGVAQRAYTFGIAAGWYNAAWAFGAVIMGLFAARRYRAMEVSTLPELFEQRYGVSGRVLGVLGQLVIQVVITALQYMAGGAILSALLPGVIDFSQGMLLTAVVFVGITLIGGLWAAGLTNILNVLLIYVGVLLGAILSFHAAAAKAGGVSALLDRLHGLTPPNPGFDLMALGIPKILAWFLIMVVTALGTQAVVQVSFAAKDPRAARDGFLLGGLLILPVGFVSALIGIAAAVLHPGLAHTAEALPRTVLDLNPFLSGLILAGLWAADVSTASALLLGSATLVVGDMVRPVLGKRLDERGERIVSRATVLVVSIATYLMAVFMSKDILRSLLSGLTLNSAYAVVTLATLFCPFLCRRGSAAWTLGATMLALLAWFFLPAALRDPLHAAFLNEPIYFVLPASLVAFFAVRLFDPRPMGKAER